MSRYQVKHIYDFCKHVLTVIIIMRAHMTPTYCIRWEKAKKCFKMFLMDSHHVMQKIYRYHAEYKLYWKPEKSNVSTPFMLQCYQSYMGTSLNKIKKNSVWNCIIFSLIAILGKYPGITWAMNLQIIGNNIAPIIDLWSC